MTSQNDACAPAAFDSGSAETRIVPFCADQQSTSNHGDLGEKSNTNGQISDFHTGFSACVASLKALASRGRRLLGRNAAHDASSVVVTPILES